ncbi:MAG: hypothetical protein HRT57_12620 [Crocinitomicaceae bacterium]|nr:hypothetical protein [Crocinitomicaceae bacterium]
MKVSTFIEYEDLTGKVRTELTKEGDTLMMVLRGITSVNNGVDGFAKVRK